MRKRAVLLALLTMLILMVGLSNALAIGPDGAAPASPYIYVSRIDLRVEPLPGGGRALASVWISDDTNQPVADAMVQAILNKPGRLPVVGEHNTNAAGRVSWTMKSPGEGVWSICVSLVEKAGYIYNPAMNDETCQMVWYP
jgi:hypothetical protein